MAYSSGGLIQAIDYNYLAWGGNTTNTYDGTINNLAMVMGIGKGYKGYGQTITAINAVSTIPATTSITATQWAGLVYTLNNALGHQSGAAAQLASGSNIGIVAGATIEAFANVSTAIGTVNTNANLYATNGSTVTGSNFTNNPTGGSGTVEGIFTRTITFANGDAARYFFNSGGQIKWVISATNNNGTLRSADLVTNFATNQAGGTIFNVSSTPRTGTSGTVTTAATNLGYWACSTTAQTISQITSANYRYEYNSDYTNVRVRTNGVQGSNGDLGSILYLDFGYYMFSTYAGLNDDINVTVTTRIDIVQPETTFLANTWGVIGIS
jgi:hypothetical protein